MGVTGAALVFRQEIQAAAYPEYFTIERDDARAADWTLVRAGLERAYPGARVSGIDWPTYRRDTFLAYVTSGNEFKTAFSHPVSGLVVGELPFDWIRALQELHFTLLAGPAGVIVNAIGAASILVMCVSGIALWWQARGRWMRALHPGVGAWAVPFLVMWAVSGLYFSFPQALRGAIGVVTPVTDARAPASTLSTEIRQAPEPTELIARAQQRTPGGRIARFVLPFGERGTFLVVLARDVHGDHDASDEVSLYFDQYSGELLQTRDHRIRTAGDTLVSLAGPVHMGSFGGLPVKILWAVMGLAGPLLAVTGVIIWRARRVQGPALPANRAS